MKINNSIIKDRDIGGLGAKNSSAPAIPSTPRDMTKPASLVIRKPGDLGALIQASFQKEQAQQSLDSIIADKIEEKEAMDQLKNRLTFATDTHIWGHLMAKGYSVADISLSLFEKTAKALEANTDQALEKQQKYIEALWQLTPKMAAYLIKNDVDLSIESIYKAQFIKDTLGNRQDGLSFHQVGDLLKEGFPDANEDYIRFLFESDIDITMENIEKLEFLIVLPDIISEDMVRFFNEKEIIFDNGVKAPISQASQLEKTDVHNHLVYHAGKNEKIKEQLAQMDSHVTSKPSDKIQHITFQKQIRELQLKLTTQVIFSLAKQGLSIDSLTIAATLTKIDELNEVLYREHLEVFTKTPPLADIAQMSHFFQGIDQLAGLEPKVYHELYAKSIHYHMVDITLMSEDLKKQQLLENISRYETKPQEKMGDSFDRARSSLLSILGTLELPGDYWHMKGVEILSTSEIDVTQGSVIHMTQLFKEIDYIAHHMTPPIAAELISNQVDIMTMDIRDLVGFIKDKNPEETGDLDLLVANYIWESKNLNSELREDMIDFYQSLHQIIKKDAIGLGLIEKMGMKLQLKDILQANKYLEKTKLSKPTIDMDASPTTQSAYEGKIETYEGWGRNKSTMENILKTATPRVLVKAMTEKDIKEKVLQELLEMLQETKAAINIEGDMLLGEYLDMASLLEPADMDFMGFFQIPETLENLHNSHFYRKNKEEIFNEINNQISVADWGEEEKKELESIDNPSRKWVVIRNHMQAPPEVDKRKKGESQVTEKHLASFVFNQRQMQFVNKYHLASPIMIDNAIGGIEIYEITHGAKEEMATVFISLCIHGRQIEDTFIAKREDIKITAEQYLERFKEQIKEETREK